MSSRTSEPYFPPGLMEYLEEREALEILMDKAQDLDMEFANVKVEFCDLDGLGWNRRHAEAQNPSFAPSSPLHSMSPHPRSTSPPRRSVNKGAPNTKSRTKTRGQKKPKANRVGGVEIEDHPEGTTYIHYTGGASLCRSPSGASRLGLVPFPGSSSDTSTNDYDHDDSLETPRPLNHALEANPRYSYFGIDDNPSLPPSIRIPTVPMVPHTGRVRVPEPSFYASLESRR